MSEVESWLDSIDLVELYKYFEEDGWNTLESVLLMTNEDILAITSKRGEISTLTNEIENLRVDLENSYSKPGAGKQQARKRSSSFARNPNQIANKKGANKRSSSVPPEDNRSLREYGNEVLAKFGIKPAMSFNEYTDINQERLDRGKFRDFYSNNYVWIEKNHVNDVGCKYDGLSRKVDQKPSHWRCEDEIERGKEYKRMNDENGDKIQGNLAAIESSRDWLVQDGGVVSRVHKMGADHAKAKYDLDNIRRNMENIKKSGARLLKR